MGGRRSLARVLVMDNSFVRRARERAEIARQAAEIEEARPYVGLAREISAEVSRIAADPSAHSDLLVELIEEMPHNERMKLAQRIFDELPSDRQWAIIEHIYGDREIETYLQAQRSTFLAEARAAGERSRVVGNARSDQRLDTRDVPAGKLLTLGLFLERDARTAVARGNMSSTCARRLVLRARGDGTFQVIEDVFNPGGGYIVTAEYSQETWRSGERLPGHTIVRVGSTIEGATGAGPSFEPIVYPGGRIDVEVAGQPTRGRLHLGFAMLGDLGIFAS